MRSSPASVVCVLAALAMFAALGCTNSPTAPSDPAALPQYAVTGASFGTEGHGAGTTPDHSNAAVVFRGVLGCGVIDGDGNWFPMDYGPDSSLPCWHELATYSKNGNAKITMQVKGVPNSTGKTVHWGPYNPGHDWKSWYPEITDGPWPCIVAGPSRDFVNDLLFTVNWHATVTPSGHATLTCIYSKKWEYNPD